MRTDTHPTTFLEVIFEFSPRPSSKARAKWVDSSTNDYFVFHSEFGAISLRKRASWPSTFANIKNDTLIFGYGDANRAGQVSRQSLEAVREAEFYGSEFLYITADCATGTVCVQRDALCTMPLFVAHQDSRLLLSNRIERLYELLDMTQLNIGAGLAYYLLNVPLNHNTFFKEISLLLERHRLEWRDNKVRIIQPPHGKITNVIANRKDDPGDPKEFRKNLEATLDRHWQAYASHGEIAAVLMSCGLDSTTVAGYFADSGHVLPWVTACHPGKTGQGQAAQIQEMVDRFCSRSTLYHMDITTDYPLGTLMRGGLWRPFFHNQEVFEVFHRLAFSLAEQNFTTIFTGFGGDELCGKDEPVSVCEAAQFPATIPLYFTRYFKTYAQASFGYDHAALPPHPLLSRPLWDVNTNFYNLFIDYNIWPVSPLCDPQLYLYCQTLPGIYRKEKNILRGYQYARRFPESIYAAPSKEYFATFFQRAVAQNLGPVVQSFLDRSVLGNLGMINTEQAFTVFKASQNTPTFANFLTIYDIYRLLVSEINLQTLGVQLSNF